MQQRKRAYHGRRGPSHIVWLIAAVVLVAAIVLVVVGLTKKPAVLPAEDPDPVVDPATPETPDNTDANTPDSTDPDGTDPAQKPDDTQQPADNQPDDKTTTASDDRISTPTACCNSAPRGTTYRPTAIRAAAKRLGTCCW